MAAPILAPVPVLLDGADTDGDRLTYTITSSDPTAVQPILLSDTNPTLKFTGIHDGNTNYGNMSFQLFQDLAPHTTARIMELVNSGFYNGLTFHRIIKDFMSQGGDPTGTGSSGSGVTFDDEYNANLQFTTKGLLAMAKSTDDSNDSQFFITAAATRWLDFQHSIFGFLTDGESVRSAINSVATGTGDKPVSPLDMGTVTVQAADGQHRVLLLKSLKTLSAGQTVTITVTANDGHGGVASRQFRVTPSGDTNNGNPFMNSFNPVSTTVGQGVAFNIPATDAEGDAINYNGQTLDSHSTISVNSTTGATVVTPAAGFVGVAGIELYVTPQGVAATNDSTRDRQDVAILVNPAAPSSLTLLSTLVGDGHSTNANNSPGNPLQFRVSGVTAGDVVTIYADGNAIGTATVATGATSVDVTTNGQSTLTWGTHSFTATQTLKDQVYTVGNVKNKHVDLASPASSVLSVQLVKPNTAPVLGAIANISIAEGQTASFVATATDADLPSDTLRYSIVTGAPAGAVIDPNTGRFTYVSSEADGGSTHQITVRVTDAAGAASDKSFAMAISELPSAPVFTQIPPVTAAIPGTTVQLKVAAHDPDLNPNPVVYSLDPGAPKGMSINASTGAITWNVPDTQAAGLVTVNVRATEKPAGGSSGMSSTAAVRLDVSNPLVELALAMAQLNSTSTASIAAPIPSVVFDSGIAPAAAPIVSSPLPALSFAPGDSGLFGLQLAPFLTGGTPAARLQGVKLKEPTLEPQLDDIEKTKDNSTPPSGPRSGKQIDEQHKRTTSTSTCSDVSSTETAEAADVVFESLGEEELAATA